MNYILDRLNSEKKSNLPMVISLITGFPSFVLYTLEVIVIVRHWRKFESAFWHLFFVRACIHIIDFLDSVIFHRQGKIPILDHSLAEQIPSALLGIGYFLWLYCYESQNLISIFIVLTRLTAIQFPVEHQTFWRRFLPFCILVTFIIPLFDTWENLGRKYRYEYDDRNVYLDNTSYGLYYDEVYYEKNYKILGYESNYKVLNAYYTADNFVFMRSSVILLVVATSLNIVTIYLYSTKQGNTTMSEEQRNMEKRLLIFTVLNFLCQLLVVLWWIIQTSCYGRHYLCNLLNNNQHWIKDIDALHSPAWLILWSSKMLRELVCKQIGIGNFWNRQHSLQQTSSQTQHQPMNNLQIINPNNNMISPTTAWK